MFGRFFRAPAAEAGNEYRVPKATRVYAIGDVHGGLDLLIRLRAMIADDAGVERRERNVVVYLGDYIDRGPESRAVVEMLRTEPLDGFEEVALKGNHEDYMLAFLDDPSIGEQWYLNGGDATLASYGVTRADMAGSDPFAAASERLRAVLPVEHVAFLGNLALYHVEGDYLFAHAGIRPGVPIAQQTDHDLMWIRRPFLSSDADHGCCVVHGHSISTEPEVRSNRVGIDTGAYYTGRLTALVLDGAERRFLHT